MKEIKAYCGCGDKLNKKWFCEKCQRQFSEVNTPLIVMGKDKESGGGTLRKPAAHLTAQQGMPET